jgi:pimeloyl-ACP methyl ester carboxylesterase
MSTNSRAPAAPVRRGRVIALHCSGAGAGQWRQLAEALSPAYKLLAPEHYGSDSTGHWRGRHTFTLAHEAARTFELIDASEEKVHVVGHSYGGGVALHVALARPHRIASLTLYEPSAFHLLKAMGNRGAAALAEIAAIAHETKMSATAGRPDCAAKSFVDYWGGAGAWDVLRPAMQAALARWVPRAPLDFHALMEEPTPLATYAGLDVPTLVIRGEHAPRPTRMIAELLPALLPAARLTVVTGAGHMGPLTHATAVNQAIVDHIFVAEDRNSHALYG